MKHDNNMKTLTLLAFALATSISARGGVVFESFGPSDSFATNCSDPLYTYAGKFTRLAVPFRPVASVILDSVTVAMHHVEGPNEILLTVQTDAAGVPSLTVLDTIEIREFLSATGSVRTGQSTLHPRLEIGTTYWVVAQPVSSAPHDMRWHCSTNGSYPRAYQSIWGEGGWGVDNEGAYALRVEGRLVPGTLPVLRIITEGTNITVSWPRVVANFDLETTSDLSHAGIWSTLSATPEVSDVFGTEQSVTEPASSEARFFRLRSQ